jgi:hypothetical protein
VTLAPHRLHQKARALVIGAMTAAGSAAVGDASLPTHPTHTQVVWLVRGSIAMGVAAATTAWPKSERAREVEPGHARQAETSKKRAGFEPPTSFFRLETFPIAERLPRGHLQLAA